MELLRRHLFSIICGIVALVGIGLMFTGARKMPAVMAEMQKAEGIHRSLTSLQGAPVSREAIEAAERRITLVNQDRDQVLAKAKELYGYEPLVVGALPEGDALKRTEFRRVYHKAMGELLASLNFGGTASQVDLIAARERIAEEEALRQEASRTGTIPPNLKLKGPSYNAAGVMTETGVRQDAVSRADIAAAQRIYCYAVHFDQHRPPDHVSSLDYRASMADLGSVDAPDLWEVWHGQIAYWIQKDVVNAIASLNNEAAESAKQQGHDAWVGIMPVKEIVSIRVSEGFIARDGDVFFGSRPGGYTEALPPGTPETVFTHSGQHNDYEVVQFTVKLIMDQRDIPHLVDRISEDSFHTLLRLAYSRVPPNRKMKGKIYGDEPTVNVVMDFETILLGEVFRCLIPVSVRDFYGVPEPENCEGAVGRDESQG